MDRLHKVNERYKITFVIHYKVKSFSADFGNIFVINE